MDIMCPRCAEPWDNDELHYEGEARGKSYAQMRSEFTAKGCEAFGASCANVSSENQRTRAACASALYDIMGDDMDGCAAMLEDAEGIFFE